MDELQAELADHLRANWPDPHTGDREELVAREAILYLISIGRIS